MSGAHLSARKHGISPRTVYVGFVVDKMALGQSFFLSILDFLVIIIPQTLFTHLTQVLCNISR
jgi:hypothetical protein